MGVITIHRNFSPWPILRGKDLILSTNYSIFFFQLHLNVVMGEPEALVQIVFAILKEIVYLSAFTRAHHKDISV